MKTPDRSNALPPSFDAALHIITATGEDWKAPGDVSEHRIFWSYLGMRLPLLYLQYEAEAYRRMGRLEKAAMIEDWLRKHDG